MAYRDFQRIAGIVSGETFYPGVVVDGVDLGGKTMEEALALLSSHETASVQGFEVFLTADGKTWRLSSDEIPLSWNTETILQQAYALGRGGSLEDRYAAIQRLETVGAYYESNYTYDKAQVREITDAIAQELHIDGWDARVVAFDVANRSFAFSDEQVGRDVDADELYQTVIEQLDAGAQGVTIPVHMMEITPSVTRAQLEAGLWPHHLLHHQNDRQQQPQHQHPPGGRGPQRRHGRRQRRGDFFQLPHGRAHK